MSIKYLYSLCLLLILFSCNSSKERPVEKENLTERPVQPADSWADFWKAFSTAVAKKDVEKVAGMTKLPLQNNLNDGGWTKEIMAERFADLFDETATAKFQQATGRDFRAMPSNEETAGYMNTPLGIELKVINVLYIFDEGTDNQTESSKTFVFGEVDGQFKLLSVMFAG